MLPPAWSSAFPRGLLDLGDGTLVAGEQDWPHFGTLFFEICKSYHSLLFA
jgi:hypothetical protein